jgi:hypothetical protein
MFLANSLGDAERRGIAGIFRTPAPYHATRNCGMNSKFFMANACIAAQIIVMPSRTSLSASGFLHHVADQFRSPAQNDLIVKNKAIVSTRDQQVLATASRTRGMGSDHRLRGHRRVSLLGSIETETAIFSGPITHTQSPGRGRGFVSDE